MTKLLSWGGEHRVICDTKSHWMVTSDGQTICQGKCECGSAEVSHSKVDGTLPQPLRFSERETGTDLLGFGNLLISEVAHLCGKTRP